MGTAPPPPVQTISTDAKDPPRYSQGCEGIFRCHCCWVDCIGESALIEHCVGAQHRTTAGGRGFAGLARNGNGVFPELSSEFWQNSNRLFLFLLKSPGYSKKSLSGWRPSPRTRGIHSATRRVVRSHRPTSTPRESSARSRGACFLPRGY